MPGFVIVRYAADPYWRMYFLEDPKKTGVPPDFSCKYTYTGKKLGIKEVYSSIEEAEKDLARLLKANPFVRYAICPLIE